MSFKAAASTALGPPFAGSANGIVSWAERAVAAGCLCGGVMLGAVRLPGLAARAVAHGLSAQDLFGLELHELLLLVEPGF